MAVVPHRKRVLIFERRHEALLPRRLFLRRFARNALLGLGFIVGSLALGMAGYRATEGLSWLDAFLNAAMILTGMGPVNPMHTAAGKVFAGCYALFSGVAFLTAVGVVFAPVFHRFLHRFHLEAHGEGGPDA